MIVRITERNGYVFYCISGSHVLPVSVIGEVFAAFFYTCICTRDVVVNFDLRERFPRPRSQQRGACAPAHSVEPCWGWVREGVAPSRWRGPGRGVTSGKFFWDFWCQIPCLGQFGSENKLIEGQPKEYDVICRNASVLAFHLWPTIFGRAPFRLQNICWNGVPPRSRTTIPLICTDVRGCHVTATEMAGKEAY